MSAFGEGRNIKARVRHRCEWCYERIDAGEICYHYKGMFDEEWQDWYMHLECEADYARNDDGDGFMPGSAERPPRLESHDQHNQAP